VEQTAAAFKSNDCDGLVAIGGGSIIDNCKAASILTGNAGPLRQYAGHPEKITGPTAPIIAVPTTAGTGAEMSRGGGIHPSHGQREFGIGGPMCQPKIAICDPELTLTLPPHLTAGTGLDALGHCIEGYLSPTINPPVDAVALDGIHRVLSYVERAVNDGYDREARWNMMMAAVQGGMSIHKGLGLAHSLSITFSDSDLHHGAVVTLCLPPVIRYVANSVGDKMDCLAEVLDVEGPDQVADRISELSRKVGLPESVRALGYGGNDIEDMANHTLTCWFNRTSPRQPTLEECRDLVIESLG
ncbi:MAG: iron-containing alcohol dehydrogenase, partial [Desulfobulbia bacterium]